MYYQLEFVTKTQKPSLVIFVHGLVGGRHTWIRDDEQHSVLNYLHANPGLRQQNDFAVFSYYTKFSDLLSKFSYFVTPLFFKNAPHYQKNLSIDQIANIFKGEVEIQGYSNLIIISHSMGGLVSKSLILKLVKEKEKITDKENTLLEEKRRLAEKQQKNAELEKALRDESKQLLEEEKQALEADLAKLEKEIKQVENEKQKVPQVKLYVSLAVPHEGANMAIWGMMLFKSRQIANLSPLNKDRHYITKKWLQTPAALLPDTVYFKGNNDRIVSRASSEAYEVRDNIKVVETSDDHFSIVCPKSSENIVITRIKEELKRVQGIEQLKEDDADLSLPGLDVQNASQKLKPRWLSFIITAMILALAAFLLVRYFPGYSAKKHKEKIVQQLNLRVFYVFNKAGVKYNLADFLLPESKVPAELKGYSLHEFLNDFTIVSRPVAAVADAFDLENKAAEDVYVLRFRADSVTKYSGLIAGIDSKFCDQLFGLTLNNEDWAKDQDETTFCKVLSLNMRNSPSILLIPKSLLK
jgi:hypothetical protein